MRGIPSISPRSFCLRQHSKENSKQEVNSPCQKLYIESTTFKRKQQVFELFADACTFFCQLDNIQKKIARLHRQLIPRVSEAAVNNIQKKIARYLYLAISSPSFSWARQHSKENSKTKIQSEAQKTRSDSGTTFKRKQQVTLIGISVGIASHPAGTTFKRKQQDEACCVPHYVCNKPNNIQKKIASPLCKLFFELTIPLYNIQKKIARLCQSAPTAAKLSASEQHSKENSKFFSSNANTGFASSSTTFKRKQQARRAARGRGRRGA